VPLLGSGAGGHSPTQSQALICQTLDDVDSPAEVLVVRLPKRG